MDVHDLTAGYALDALDADERDTYEEHLAQCEECRVQLAELTETASALAFGTVAPAPPLRLRESILAEAAAQRTNVIPLRPRSRWTPRALTYVAAAAACVAVGFGLSTLRSNGPRVVSATVVVGANHTATMNVTGLANAPQGKTYEAWIIPAGGTPRPAGLMAGSGSVSLRGTVPPHATVAVTVEPAGGDNAPTTAPIVTAQT